MRTAILFSHEYNPCEGRPIGPQKVASTQYQHTTQAHARQVADELAREHGIRSGHVALIEDGHCIDTLEVLH